MLGRPAGGWDPLIARAAGVDNAQAPWFPAAARYLDEVVEWNRHTDLTAARSTDELVDLTVADAVEIARVSGAGATALPSRKWDIAVSRATLPPADWLREGSRRARRIWVLLAREEAPTAAGVALEDDLRYEWPLTHVPRRAVRYARE